ncbi:hypothetical protein MJG53_011609 [Ovis ammon polii x Ovis aries]|uniref:Uncharacterized protein n=1 Tax=Ovis ammon polii x Ovis aries TaxID=2918886 RepID=A0ACB9UP49_9CETA|nr:hypothetical protein MJG53_011609 [Ovis ammon polii x Ovis aries]
MGAEMEDMRIKYSHTEAIAGWLLIYRVEGADRNRPYGKIRNDSQMQTQPRKRHLSLSSWLNKPVQTLEDEQQDKLTATDGAASDIQALTPISSTEARGTPGTEKSLETQQVFGGQVSLMSISKNNRTMIMDDAVRILFHFKEVFYNSERPQFQNNKTIAIDDALNIFCHLKEMFYRQERCIMEKQLYTRYEAEYTNLSFVSCPSRALAPQDLAQETGPSSSDTGHAHPSDLPALRELEAGAASRTTPWCWPISTNFILALSGSKAILTLEHFPHKSQGHTHPAIQEDTTGRAVDAARGMWMVTME